MGLRAVLWSLRHPLSSPPDAEQKGSPYWFGRGGDSPAETIGVRRGEARAWEGGAEGELDVTDRARIIENVRGALASKGWTLQVQE